VTGFSGETEEEHAATLDLMRAMRYEQAFMFAYRRVLCAGEHDCNSHIAQDAVSKLYEYAASEVDPQDSVYTKTLRRQAFHFAILSPKRARVGTSRV